jgi:Flp pilus assembly protein TadD
LAGCKTLQLQPGAAGQDGVTVTPANPNAGTVASTTENSSDARESIAALRPTDDQQVHMHLDLARAFDEQGETDKAIGQYQKAIELYVSQGPRRGRGDAKARGRLHRRLGTACDRLGRFGDAEEHYQQAIKLIPRDALVWNDAGYSQYLQGNWKGAEERLRKATSLDPTNPRFKTNLGLALAAAGRVDDAILVLETAGGKASAHVNVGYILAAQGKVEAARQHYRAALSLAPDLKQAAQALAKLETQAPKRDEATQVASGVRSN